MRAREWPTLLVAGNGSIHTAVKCCLTAARFVQPDGLIVSFEPLFRAENHGRALLALSVLPCDPQPLPAAGAFAPGSAVAAAAAGAFAPGSAAAAAAAAQIKVGAHSRHANVGAALSSRLVEGGSPYVVLSALGETAVANAVMAAAHAQHYLSTQSGRRLAVEARAAVVVKGGDQLVGVQLWVRLQPPGSTGGAADAGAPNAAAAAGPSGGAMVPAA
ncbi:hypothetical protein MNEG_10257 [Monoraphidium neglectum]|uniref:Uncharacterized protein n=1 Tax=Monoraphidium neglectum TaxID=145388 RepID=A0A0D2KQ48_9CHLO|nr:hypothetical protein MNEG_10257 [Monoraphidium neglectum]KIY97703.1 hypothetical protein MNEG_10257 [Monoraphidium neglectum]|eukprot:XP_013896723.1 hypothetical protein MNEG_10257 [Monoraphidium neglectum]